MEKKLELAKGIADYFGFGVIPLVAVTVATAFFLLPAHIVGFAGWTQDDPEFRRWMSILLVSGICLWGARLMRWLYRTWQKFMKMTKLRNTLSDDEMRLLTKLWVQDVASGGAINMGGGVANIERHETEAAFVLLREKLAVGSIDREFLTISYAGEEFYSWLRRRAGD